VVRWAGHRSVGPTPAHKREVSDAGGAGSAWGSFILKLPDLVHRISGISLADLPTPVLYRSTRGPGPRGWRLGGDHGHREFRRWERAMLEFIRG